MLILLGRKTVTYACGVAIMLIFTTIQGATFVQTHQVNAESPMETIVEEEEKPINNAAASPTPMPTATPTPTPTGSERDFVSLEMSVAEEQQRLASAAVLSTIEEAAIEAQLSEYFTEDEIIMAAKLIHAEAGSVYPLNRRAAVIWTVCNRIDNGYSSSRTTVSAVITQPGQFAYYSGCSYSDLDYAIAKDVLTRWATEQITGETNEGRILPSQYMFFWGDGSQNHFNDGKGNYWDYSVEYDPYEDWE